MKKWSSLVLLSFLLFSQFQIGTLYANSVTELSTEKQKQIEVLETVEQVIDATIEKIDAKTDNHTIETRLAQKEAEVEEYLAEVKENIEQENSTQDIQEKVQEAKKVVVLKVVSGVTPYEDIEDNISQEVADTPEERQEAKEAIQDSLETITGDYSLFIKTTLSESKTEKLFHTFDTDITLTFMYEVEGVKYFEVTIPNTSIFRQEMMENIEQGILPETYMGIEIVQPEVYGIGETEQRKNGETQTQPTSPQTHITQQLTGEELGQTWGIQEYETYEHFDTLAQQDSESAEKVTVGVIDTGIDYRHPDLSANTSGGYDFVNEDTDPIDDQGHGTHVAGTIGANLNNQGIIGVNPYIELVPLKICNAQGFCPSYAALRALDYAREENIDIINMSLGGRANPNGHSICEGIAAYTQAGGIVVTAAGNSNIDTLQFVPGGCDNVISVAAIDQNNSRASFSNYGTKVDVSAPGVNIYSTSPGNSYRQLSGTSMATPHVTGLVSILKMYDSSLTTQEAEILLKNYPKSVSSESSKPIANGVNFAAMMTAITTESHSEGNEESQDIESYPEEGNDEESSEESSIDSNSESAGNVPELPESILQRDTHADDDEEWVLENSFTPSTTPITIDFGKTQEIIETNDTASSFEIIDIDEIAETQKPSVDIVPLRVYDEQGNIVPDAVEINNDVELFPLAPNTGEVTQPLEVIEEDEEEEEVVKEVFIDGATKGTHINSVEEGEEMVMEPFEESTLYDNEGNPITLSDIDEEQILILSSTGSEVSSSETIIQSSLVGNTDSILAHFPFNGDANDISGNGFHGDVYGAQLTTDRHGNADSAYFFDGQNDGIVIPGMQGTLGNSDFSVSFWVEIDGVNSTLGSYYDTWMKGALFYGLNPYFRLGIDETNKLSLQQKIGNTWYKTISSNVVNTGEWMHIVATHDSSTGHDYLYINGELVGQGISSIETFKYYYTSQHQNSIGARKYNSSTPNTNFFHGKLDDMIVYNKHLSLEDIQKLYPLPDVSTVNHNEGPLFLSLITPDITSIESTTPTVNITLEGTYEGSNEGEINYSYSFDGQNFTELPGSTSIQSYEQEYEMSSFETPNFFELGTLLSEPPEPFLYQDNGEESNYVNENQDLEIGIQSANTIFQDDMSDGIVDSFYTINSNNRTTEQSGYLQTSQVATDQQSSMYSQWFSTSEDVLTIEYDFYSHPGSDYFYGGMYLIADDAGTEEYFYDVHHYYTKHLGGYIPLKNEIRVRGRSLNESGHSIFVTRDGLHNQWVHYKMEFDFANNTVKQIINDQEYNIDMDISTIQGKNIRMRLSPYGWWTGHYIRMDNLKIEQHSSTPEVQQLYYNFDLDLTNQPNGQVHIYAKATNGEDESNTVTTTLTKIAPSTIEPTNFEVQFEYNENAFYTWETTENNSEAEGKYVLRDQNDLVIVDNIHPGSSSYTEESLENNQTLQRKICKIDQYGEACSNLITFTTPQEIPTYDIYETRQLRLTIYHNITSEIQNSDIISLTQNGEYVWINPESPGKTYVKVITGYNNRPSGYQEFYINVLPAPEVTVYPVELYNGQGLNVYLPEPIENYSVTWSGIHNLLDKKIQYDSHFYVRSQRTGEHTIHLKDENDFDIYRIEITSSPQEAYLTLVQTEYDDPGLSPSDDHYVDNGAIASIIYGDNIQGNAPGTTHVDTYDDGVHKQITNVTVLPIPDPIEINCTMYKHEKCRLDYYHGGAGIGFTTNNPDHIEVEYGTSTTRVSGSASGTATVTIRAHNANYTKYIMNVTILPDPVQEYDCTFPLNLECQTRWYDNEGEYAITTTNPTIVDVQLERYYQDPEDTTSQILERTKIIGRQEGTADVYIYHNGDHKATVHVTVDPPVPTIQVEDGSVTVKQGENIEIQILNGGGDYRVVDFESEYINFDVDNHSGHLGDIDITGRDPGTTYPTFRDQYYQEYQMSVHVEDTTLDLTLPATNSDTTNGIYTMTLPDGNSEYITATNYYQDVTYTKSNDNIRINKQVMNYDQIAFLITPLIEGETEITFTDNETETIDGEQVHVNTKTVVVTVGDGNNNGQPVEQPFDVSGNLIHNGAFNGEGVRTSYGWIGDKDTNRWHAHVKNNASASLINGRLELEVQGNESYVEIRNRSGGYYTVTTESILVEPNTSYILEYDYETQYISGTKDRGFKVGIFLSESSGVKSASYQTIDYVSDTVPTTNVRYEFTTPDDAHYLTVSPVIYGHTGTDKNLAMKAWVDNMSLVEKEKDIFEELDDVEGFFDTLLEEAEEGLNTNTSDSVPTISLTKFISKINTLLNRISHDEAKLNLLISEVNSLTEVYTNKSGITEQTRTNILAILDYLKSQAVLRQKGLGMTEGMSQALSDYADIIDVPNVGEILNNLASISYRIADGDLVNGEISGEITDAHNESQEIARNIWGIVESFDQYHKYYYIFYAGTYGTLSVIPAGRAKYVKGDVDSPDISQIKQWNQTYKDGGLPILNPRGKVEDKIDHIIKIDFKPDGTFGGVHSRKAVIDYNNTNGAGSAWFDDLDEVNTDTWNQPYRAKVYAKDSNGNTVLKTGGSGYSSVFPDSWSQQKIVDEVAYAVKNNKGKYTGPGAGPNEYKGFSTEGMQIHFYLDSNGGVISYFPKIY